MTNYVPLIFMHACLLVTMKMNSPYELLFESQQIKLPSLVLKFF